MEENKNEVLAVEVTEVNTGEIAVETAVKENKQVVNLTLEGSLQPEAMVISDEMDSSMMQIKEVEKADVAVAQLLDDSMLTVEEKKIVDDFSKQIDIKNSNQILMYGSSSQTNISNFSETALKKVKNQDIGEVGGILTNLVGQLQGFDFTEKKGFFGRIKNNAKKLTIQYTDVEKNIENVTKALQDHQIQLMKDIAVMDQMYDQNLMYYKELTMYILAGKKRLQDGGKELEEMRKKAEVSKLPEDAQAANDYGNMINRFEKKIHDLELTRIVSIQMGPQIRLVQNNDIMLVEKIQTSIVNTIPLWKNQMVLTLGIAHGQKALESQRAVTDMTNKLLQQNADTLKMGTIETAKESERGIVDLETLRYTNEQLISTLDEVLSIQEDGRQRRKEAEQELAIIEGDLKQKLLQVRSASESVEKIGG